MFQQCGIHSRSLSLSRSVSGKILEQTDDSGAKVTININSPVSNISLR